MYNPFDGAIETREEGAFCQRRSGTKIYFPALTDVGKAVTFRSGRSFTVVAADQRGIPMVKYPFVYQSWHHPKIRELRERLDLDKRLGATTGFERISRLVRLSRFELLGIFQKWGWSEFWETLNYPLPGYASAGFCNECSHRLVALAAACGFIARKVNTGRADRQKSLPHICTEIWSDEHQKWVFWDAMVPYYFEDVSTGQPLSMSEIQDRHLAGQPDSVRARTWRKPGERHWNNQRVGRDGMAPELVTIDYARHARTCLERYWVEQFHWCLMYLGNDQIDMPYNRFNFTMALLMKEPLDEDSWRIRGKVVRSFEHKTFLKVWDVHNLYQPQNQVEIHVADTAQGPVVGLAHFTPNFDHLELRINGRAWKKAGTFTALNLTDEITLEARTVNAAGICGKSATVVLQKTPGLNPSRRARMAGRP